MKNNSQKHTVCPAITMPETLNYLGYHRRKAPASLCKTISSMHAVALKIAEPKRMISIQEVSVNDDKIFFNRHAFYSQSLSHLWVCSLLHPLPSAQHANEKHTRHVFCH